ncbi:MAG: DUF2130 domain-containing protein [Candidatus Daviesbacteria bacterium]|nr:DUF2130 domain-containing protein [Candidatus Daviesbacteria bacterium]
MTVTCPKCQHKFSVDEALVPQIAEARSQIETELRQKMLDWQKNKEEILNKDVEEKLKALKKENEKKTEELKKTRELELKLLNEKKAFEDEKQTFELKVQRQMNEEREKIRENVSKVLMEEHQLKDAENLKKIADMSKMIEELKLKAGQGSQQLQGEVLELELEELLIKTFPLDEILPVGKGITGADVVQKVRDTQGKVCGSIIWESKRTKNWTEGWVMKLKDDLRASKGNVAVLVTSVLPPEINKFGPRDGIYVTNFESFLSVASLLRIALIEQNKTKLSVVGKNEKMDAIYNYLSGSEFRQRVEAIVESFSGMQSDLEKEKRMYTQIWAKREKQIQKVLDSTIGMHGDLQGLMGASLPQLPSLDIEIDEIEIMIEENLEK